MITRFICWGCGQVVDHILDESREDGVEDRSIICSHCEGWAEDDAVEAWEASQPWNR